MWKIKEEVHIESIEHDSENPQEAYASRLSKLSLTEGEILDGRTVLKALIYRCTLWLEIMRQKYDIAPVWYLKIYPLTLTQNRQGKISEPFQELYEKLIKIRNQLEQMNLTQAWSLRETDL